MKGTVFEYSNILLVGRQLCKKNYPQLKSCIMCREQNQALPSQ